MTSRLGSVAGAGASTSSGVAPALIEQLKSTHQVDLRDTVTVMPASETILESTQKAFEEAEAWLAARTV